MKVYQRHILLLLLFLTNISCNKRVRDNYKLPYKHFPDMWGYKTENTLLQNPFKSEKTGIKTSFLF